MPDGVLITRPEPGARETARRVRGLGYRPILAPLLEIRSVGPALPPCGHVQAIIVSSANAIPALPATHQHLPLLAVGDATAARARAAGFTRVSSADGDATALAKLAAGVCEPRLGPLLFVCGKSQGAALAGDLRARGFSVLRRAVYDAAPVERLPHAARQALLSGGLSAALFYSAETARNCVRLIRGERLDETVRKVDALAIGAPTAMALQALPWRRTCIAARPNQEAMLALLQ